MNGLIELINLKMESIVSSSTEILINNNSNPVLFPKMTSTKLKGDWKERWYVTVLNDKGLLETIYLTDSEIERIREKMSDKCLPVKATFLTRLKFAWNILFG